MAILLLVAMLVTGVGALVFMKKAKAGDDSAKPVAGVLAVVTFLLAIGRLLPFGGTEAQDLVEAAEQYQYAGGETLGAYVAETFSDARTLILVREETPDVPFSVTEKAVLEGLEDSLQAGGIAAERYEVRPSEDKIAQYQGGDTGDQEEVLILMLMSPETWFNTEALLAALRDVSDRADIVINTLGTPMDLAQASVGDVSALPDLAVVNGNSYGLASKIRNGLIDAMVVYKSASHTGEGVPSDTAEAFEERFLLVTPATLDQAVSEHPRLFGP